MNPSGTFRLMKIPIAVLGLFLFSLLVNRPLKAQSQPVSGTIEDSSGAPMPGASVTIKDLAKGDVVRHANTDETGRFQAINMQPGKYTITIEKTGFKTAQVNINVDVNQKVDIGKITIDVGQVTEMISVNEVAPAVETSTMEKAYLLDQTQMSQLPMNGRNWTALMSTLPGMTSSAQSDFNVNFNDVSQFHGLGGRGSENNFYLDGSPNVDVGDNQSQYTQPSIDSIAEFRVLQSAFNAEYGRAEGVAVAVQTKSGSAQFHGTLYEYVRNDLFDAKQVNYTINQPLRYNQFGGNFSGWVPIPKLSPPSNKKIFFFYNREMTRRDLPGTAYSDVPSPALLNGDFSSLLTKQLDINTADATHPNGKYYVGQIFQPGTVTRNSQGNISGGTPFVNNQIPSTMFNSTTVGLLKPYTNIPNYNSLPAIGNAGTVRYTYNNADVLEKNQDLLRIDYAISSKVNSFFRWVNDYQKESFQTGVWAGEAFPIQPQARPKPGSSWSYNLVTTFTPTLAAETVLSYNKQSQSLSIIGDNPVSVADLSPNFPQLYPAANITGSIPNVQAGLVNISLGNPGWHNWGKDYSITENVTKVFGPHTMKFGMYLNRDDKAQTATWPQNATIVFNGNSSMAQDSGNGLANLLLGNFQNYYQSSAAIFPYFRFESVELYAQDSWKVTPRLTVEYGIRFQRMVPTFTVVRGGTPGGEGTFKLYSVDLTQYDPSKAPVIDNSDHIVGDALSQLTQEGLVCDPCSGVPRGFSPTKNLFTPRLGFAYDVFGNGKTALRAGFGMFNERLRQNNFNFGAGSSFPNTSGASVQNTNISGVDVPSIVGGSGLAPSISPPGEIAWPRSNTMPTIYSWYAGVQHQLPGKFVFDGSYSGSHSVHLMDQRQVNAIPAGTFFVGFADPLRPYTGWGSLNAVETESDARYNAMMLRVSRRFANNLSANFNYTFSKAMDEVDNDSDNVQNPFNLRQNWGLAGYDQTHVFSVDIVYDLPSVKGVLDKPVLRQIFNGWELTGIYRAQSGMPITVTNNNGNLGGVDLGNQYVDVVGDPYSGNNKSQWLNPAAFKRPANGSFGNEKRNQFRLPAIQNLDASLIKNFSITERAKLTYRFEVFNVPNHPEPWGFGNNNQFSGDNPGSGLSSTNTTFGQINTWRDQRTIQMALRFAF